MTSYKQGAVVLVPFPFTDLSTTKERPALVISTNKYNQAKPDCILVAITSQIPQSEESYQYVLSGSECQAGGLFQASSVITGKLFTIENTKIYRQIGDLPGGVLQQVISLVIQNFQ